MGSLISSRTAKSNSEIHYPDSDGLPMANNTEHWKIIAAVKHGLESTFADREDVFVAADLFWYPVQGRPQVVLAPDVMVAIGRPRGDRKSYKQWEEDGIAPQVVFEFLSDSNTHAEMARKAAFFERYGVQEYYLYDIERNTGTGLIRFQESDDGLEEIPDMQGWKSPRLGIRFEISDAGLHIYKPDGTEFLEYDEIIQLDTILDATRSELSSAKTELSSTKDRLNSAESRAEALAAKLRALGINPDDV